MKRVYYIIYLIYAVLIMNYLYAAEPENHNKKEFGPEYFKIDNNKLYVFDSDFGETISRIEMFDTGYKLINENDDFSYSQTLVQNEDGLYLKNTEQEVDLFLFLSSSIEILYPEPILQLPKPLMAGDKWNWEGYQIQDGDSVQVSIDGHIVGEDSVTVPAGEFNALKIEFYIETSSGEKSSVSQWLVPNLGRIKLHAEIDDPGLIGLFMDIFGYSEIVFELKEIRDAEL